MTPVYQQRKTIKTFGKLLANIDQTRSIAIMTEKQTTQRNIKSNVTHHHQRSDR
jgi:hypothetical protein